MFCFSFCQNVFVCGEGEIAPLTPPPLQFQWPCNVCFIVYCPTYVLHCNTLDSRYVDRNKIDIRLPKYRELKFSQTSEKKIIPLKYGFCKKSLRKNATLHCRYLQACCRHQIGKNNVILIQRFCIPYARHHRPLLIRSRS